MSTITGRTNGKRSTEFWLTLLGNAMALLVIYLGNGSGSPELIGAGGGIAAVMNGFYSMSRAKTKAAVMHSKSYRKGSDD